MSERVQVGILPGSDVYEAGGGHRFLPDHVLEDAPNSLAASSGGIAAGFMTPFPGDAACSPVTEEYSGRDIRGLPVTPQGTMRILQGVWPMTLLVALPMRSFLSPFLLP